MKKIMTLCLVHKNSQVLLGMKKRGFGAGRWNGFGGKVHNGESISDAAARELAEECGIRSKHLEQRAILGFRLLDTDEDIEIHLFEVMEFEGEPMETEEMRPQWFYKNEIPYDKMWPDDRFWFPYFLEGKKFKGHFLFRDKDKMLDYQVTEVEKL